MPDAMDGVTDEVLLEKYNAGDPRALEMLLDRYERPLYNFLARQVRDPERARDLLQEVLLRLVQKADGFRGQSSVRTWLYRIARNLCIDHARRQVHRRHASLDADRGEGSGKHSLYDRVADVEVGAENRVADRELAIRIEAAVEALPDEQREVFLMRHVQNLAFKEIADIVGIPENTAKSRMRYALERLQQTLADYRRRSEGAS